MVHLAAHVEEVEGDEAAGPHKPRLVRLHVLQPDILDFFPGGTGGKRSGSQYPPWHWLGPSREVSYPPFVLQWHSVHRWPSKIPLGGQIFSQGSGESKFLTGGVKPFVGNVNYSFLGSIPEMSAERRSLSYTYTSFTENIILYEIKLYF